MEKCELSLPEGITLDQDEEWIWVSENGSDKRRIRLHNYGAIYDIPGLYEKLFCSTLKSRSWEVIPSMLAYSLNKSNGTDALRVLDFGAGNRVVAVVNLPDEIHDRQLQLMRPEPAAFVSGRQTQATAEEQQDVRRLCDQAAACGEHRRCERGTGSAVSEDALDRRDAAAVGFRYERRIDVVCTAFLECEPDELAAPLYARPVIERVLHVGVSALVITM